MDHPQLQQEIHVLHPEGSVVERWGSTLMHAVRSTGSAAVLSPWLERDGIHFDWSACERALESVKDLGVSRLVLLSNAAVYGTGNRHPRYIDEARIDARKIDDPYALQWRRFEAAAQRLTETIPGLSLIVLRLAPLLMAGAGDWLNRALNESVWYLPLACESPVQLLAEDDLLRALARAIDSQEQGAFNLAPEGAIRWSDLARAAGKKIRPGLQLATFTESRFTRPQSSFPYVAIAGYVSNCWTVNPARFNQCFSFRAQRSSHQALACFLNQPLPETVTEDDPFGMDRPSIVNRRWHHWATAYYWRFEVKGLEHVPRHGRGILFGPHRGFMPFDGAMLVYWLMSRRQRIPRFLVHSCLLKFPVISRYISSLGGIPACRENARWVLEQDELLAVFPEGIQATFTPYREAYQLASFGRSDYVKWALKYRAPLLPFVIVGAAESYPILHQFKWRWWKKTFEWPGFPITPTFPCLPLPLPTKWSIVFLPPIPLHELYPPEAAEDYQTVRAISDALRTQLQEAWLNLKACRQGWFR